MPVLLFDFLSPADTQVVFCAEPWCGRVTLETARETIAATLEWSSSHHDPAAMDERRYRMIESMLDLGWTEVARNVLSGMLEENPDRPTALALFARIGVLDGNHEDAMTLVRHVMSVDPANDAAARTYAMLQARAS